MALDKVKTDIFTFFYWKEPLLTEENWLCKGIDAMKGGVKCN